MKDAVLNIATGIVAAILAALYLLAIVYIRTQ
jgi:hypothetical protein